MAAFSPFQVFRKYSKVMFAILAIICMFTFVLSSGLSQGADFFDWLPRQIGINKIEKQTLATAFDEPIRVRDVQALRKQREIANRFMHEAISRSNRILFGQLKQDVAKLPPTLRPLAEQIVRSREALYQVEGPDGSKEPDQAAFFEAQQYMQMMRGPELVQSIYRRMTELDPEKQATEVNIMRYLLQILAFDSLNASMPRSARALYFSNEPFNETNLAEFALWLKEADRLGIRYSTTDVSAAVDRETLGALKKTDAELIIRGIRRDDPTVTNDVLMTALGNEFRVRTARTLILGTGAPRLGNPATKTEVPSFLTPYELAKEYEDRCTAINVKMFALPIRNFFDEAKKLTPSEQELRTFFEKHRLELPDPSKATPGFKEPRRIRVEYIEFKSIIPYYSEQAEKQRTAIKIGGIAAQLAPTTGFLQFGTIMDEWLDAQAVLDAFKAFNKTRPTLTDSLTPGQYFPTALTPLLEPTTLVGLLGQFGGGLQTGTTPLAPVLSLQGPQREIVAKDQATRVSIGAWSLLMPLGNPYFPLTAPPAVHQAAAVDLPFEKAKFFFIPKLLADRKNERAKSFGFADRKEFRRKLDEKSQELAAVPSNDKLKFENKLVEIENYIKDYAKERGLVVRRSAEFRDRFTIGKRSFTANPEELEDLIADEEMLPLVSTFKPISFDGSEKLVGDIYFPQPDRFNSNPAKRIRYEPIWTNGSDSALQSPEPQFPGLPETTAILTWIVEEKPERVLKFEEARPAVLKAWRFAKAREMARKSAEAVVAEIKEKNLRDRVTLNQLKDGNRYRFGSEFDLTQIAKLERVPSAVHSGQMGVTYQPFDVTKSIRTFNISYPTPALGESVLELRKQDIGATTIVTNQPEDHIYVAVLLGKTTPTNFTTAVYPKGNVKVRSEQDTFVSRIGAENRPKVLSSILERMKTLAKYTETDELKRSQETAKNDR